MARTQTKPSVLVLSILVVAFPALSQTSSAQALSAGAADEGAANSLSAQEQCERGHLLEFPSTYNRIPPIIKANNMVEAIRWYRRSAERGWPGGQYHLALCYLGGKGLERDEQRGLELIRAAADQGHPGSLVKLAELYAQRIGEPRGANDRPVDLLLQAARRNSQQACEALVLRYQSGLGTDRDLMEAARWYCEAAMLNTRGYSLAGKVLTPEQARRADPFSRSLSLWLSAAQLDGKAMAEIGGMYFIGNNVPRSSLKAWIWLNLAARNGAEAAKAEILQVEKELTPNELSQGKVATERLANELRKAAAASSTFAPREQP